MTLEELKEQNVQYVALCTNLGRTLVLKMKAVRQEMLENFNYDYTTEEGTAIYNSKPGELNG